MTDLSQPTPQHPVSAPDESFHWPSFLMVILTGLSLFGFFGGAAVMAFSGLISLFDSYSSSIGTATVFSYALSGVVISLMLLPPLIFNIQRFAGKRNMTSQLLEGRLEKFPVWGLILVYLGFVGAGTLLLPVEAVSWLVMPVFNVGALGLPVLIIMRLGAKNLQGGTLHTKWSVFSAGMVFSPAIIFLIEVFSFFIGIILIALLASSLFPQIQDFISDLLPLFESAAIDPVQLDILVGKLLGNPAVIALMLFFLSVFVPVVEELLKPAAIWLLSGRQLGLQDGWVLGLLSGAGFALVENLGNVAIGEGWGYVALARFGATALHMFNTGIIGYTFVLSKQEKRYWRLVLVILGTFVIHGVWNALAIFASIRSIGGDESWPPIIVALLALVTGGLVYALVTINKKLQPVPEIETETELNAVE